MQFSEINIQKLFGSEAAEDENIDRLKEYYFKNEIYDRVISDLPLRILVGHKGIGKSALFKIAMSEDTEKGMLPILIKPDDIADLGNNQENVLQTIRDWKQGLLKIICNRVFSSFGMKDETGFFTNFLNGAGSFINFFCESYADEQKTINTNPAKNQVLNNFLKTKIINVYIDDLDRGWQSRQQDIWRISALINAVRDISNENHGLNFKISLRSDVYFLVRTSDESTDKIEGSVVWHTWTNQEIFLLLIKRIQTFFGRPFDVTHFRNLRSSRLNYYLIDVFEEKFSGPDTGRWNEVQIFVVLMSMIRQRPRDLVKLCSLAAVDAVARKSDLIRTENLKAIFPVYSQGRIQDTINEYRSELPQIEKLILEMKPSKKQIRLDNGFKKDVNSWVFTTNELNAKLNNIMQHGQFKFANGKVATSKDLAQFLYKINFITAKKEREDGSIDRKYFEANQYLSSTFVDFGYDWEIHPAYRWALQPDRIEDIFLKISFENFS